MSNVPLVLAKVPREFFSSKAIRGRAAPGLYALGFFLMKINQNQKDNNSHNLSNFGCEL